MLKRHFSILLLAGLAFFSSATWAAEVERRDPSVDQVQVVTQAETINLNTADVALLAEGLVGVGKVKAQAIVTHREANGAFASVDELLEVDGIGASILESNRARLSVN